MAERKVRLICSYCFDIFRVGVSRLAEVDNGIWYCTDEHKQYAKEGTIGILEKGITVEVSD